MSAPQTTALPDLVPVFRTLPGLFVALTPELTILEMTDAYLKARHTSRAALQGKHLTDTFTGTSALLNTPPTQALEQSLQHVLFHKQAHHIPVFCYNAKLPEALGGGFKDYYWSITNTPVLDDTGELLYILHEARETTDKHHETAQHSFEYISLLSGNMQAVSWEYDLVHNKMYWGPSLQEILGYTPEEMGAGGESWDHRVHPDDFEAVQASIELANNSGSKIWTGEYRFRKADGTYIPVLDQGYIIYHSDGRPIRTIGAIIDLSKNQKTDEKVQESGTRFKHLLEVLPHPAWMAETSGRVLYFNKNWYSYTGMDPEQTEGWISVIHPEDTASVLTEWHHTLESGAPYEKEYRLLNHHDKSYRWFLERGVPVYADNGKLQYWIGTLTDIEDQKQVVQRIREKDEQLEHVLNHSPVHFCLLRGHQHICHFVTPGVSTLFGNRNYLNKPVREIWPEMQQTDFFKELDEVYSTGKTMQVKEYKVVVDRLRNGDLTDVYLNLEYRPLITNGRPEGILISAIDVNELVKTRQQMDYNQYSLQLLAQATGSVTWEYNVKEKKMTWGKAYTEVFGYKDAELTTAGSDWDSNVHPSDFNGIRKSIDAAIANRQRSWTGEYRYRKSDGSYATVLDHGYILYDEEGNPEQMLGSVIDITRQKDQEVQLQHNSERFKRIAMATTDVIWDWNLEDDSIWWSEGYSSTFGYPEHDTDLHISSWTDHIHPDDLEHTKHSIEEAINGQDTTWEEEYRFRCADGSYKLIVDKGYIIRAANGKATRMCGAMVDVTETRKIEQQLQESSLYTKLVLESLPLMVWTTRPDGYHEYFNQRWMDYTGLNLEESIGQVWIDMVHPDDRQRSWERWQHSLRTGEYYEIEYRFKNGRNGSYRWFLGQAIPMHDVQGNIVKWFGTCTDIEDHKKAEEELVEKNLELERINQDLDSFVYTASHDLKLPVTNMAGIFQELVRCAEFKDPDAPELISMFNKSLDQIYNTINDLAEVVKVQKANVREQEQVNLNELTEDIKVSIQDTLAATGTQITTDFAEVPALAFSKANLRSILFNLLSNSIKYRHPNRKPVVQLNATRKGDYVELKVQDNGLGFDMNKHESKLFQMFKRFHNHVSGSGLGLYIVNRLMTNSGGYINIESTPNKGTTFYLYFKQKKVQGSEKI